MVVEVVLMLLKGEAFDRLRARDETKAAVRADFMHTINNDKRKRLVRFEYEYMHISFTSGELINCHTSHEICDVRPVVAHHPRDLRNAPYE